MAKKDYFLIVDTETTMKDHVVDFGAVVTDRKGRVHKSCGILVRDIYEVEELFYDRSESKGIWSWQGRDKRIVNYQNMLAGGTRIIASVGAINRWLDKVKTEYNPILTAYNLAFDKDKCAKTGIDLLPFDKSFCLWYAAAAKWGHSKEFKQMVLDMHEFRPPTEKGNMSYRTNAETMTRFVLGRPDLQDEPHTALEDAMDYELPILVKLVNTQKRELWMNPPGYNWRDYQVKDHFMPR